MEFSIYGQCKLPTQWGEFDVIIFRTSTNEEHMAICKGNLNHQHAVLTRIHSACITGEALRSLKCDCGLQLEYALKKIEQEQLGIVIYLFQEGRGIGLGNKIRAYALQDQGIDTVDANLHLGFEEDPRTYEIALVILQYFGINSVRLMSNNPIKIQYLENANIQVVERISIEVGINPINHDYLTTKKERMGHLLDLSSMTPKKKMII